MTWQQQMLQFQDYLNYWLLKEWKCEGWTLKRANISWKVFLKFRFCHTTIEYTSFTSLVCFVLKFYIRDENLDPELPFLRLRRSYELIIYSTSCTLGAWRDDWQTQNRERGMDKFTKRRASGRKESIGTGKGIGAISHLRPSNTGKFCLQLPT